MKTDTSKLQFRKSSKSGPVSDNCVEVALFDGGAAVRDSKDRSGPVLLFSDNEWSAFLDGAEEFRK